MKPVLPILIPIRGLHNAKSRLREDIEGELVEKVILRLLRRTIEYVHDLEHPIYLLTTDERLGDAIPIKVSVLLDDGKSLNKAIRNAILTIDEEEFMVLMPDLPGLNTASLEKILHLHLRYSNVIAPTGDGGTAIGILSRKILHEELFGEFSASKFQAFCKEERIELSSIHLPELIADLDTIDDWQFWEHKLEGWGTQNRR